MAPDQHIHHHHHHALVLPFPLQGHISPLLQLSQHLASSHGFRITFVNTEYNHRRFLQANYKKSSSSSSGNNTDHAANYSGYNISMVGVSDGLPLEEERTASDMRRVVESMALHMKPLLEQLISGINKQEPGNAITCIIADIFMPWAPDLASTCGIPAFIGFHASSIAQFSFLYHIPLLLSSGQLNPDGTLKDADQQRLSGIPGVVDIPVSSVPWLVGDVVRNESTFHGLAAVRTLVDRLDCVLFNSFTEMEKEAVDALVKETRLKMAPVGPMLLLDSCNANGDSQYSIGKVSYNHGTATAHAGNTGLLRDRDQGGCLEWLEGRVKHSVLYVAFGTTAWLSREELHALARGIEASEVAFLWVLRQDLLHKSDSASALPEGFVERTKARAYFTSWAPQTLVLSHPAIGAFLTHGGWNSTLEAISYGVPMLLWPDFWDQKFHTEQAVEQWKVGLRVRMEGSCKKEQKRHVELHEQGAAGDDDDDGGGDGDEVEKLVRRVMSGEEGKQMRERAAALSSKARLAVQANLDSGSSHNHLLDVIRSLEAKLLKT